MLLASLPNTLEILSYDSQEKLVHKNLWKKSRVIYKHIFNIICKFFFFVHVFNVS